MNERPLRERGISTAAVLVALVGAALLVLLGWGAWNRVHSGIAQDARAAHLEAIAPHRARLIEPLGAVPPELVESSGVAVSRHHEGVLWTHNDSGDDPVLYAIDPTGRLLTSYVIANAEAVDWEDIALGRCPRGSRAARVHCLYIGDTGDNQRQRDALTIYVVAEPDPRERAAEPPLPAQRFRFVYPDEPHDTESLAVTTDGDVLTVSKGRTGSIDFFRMTRAEVRGALATGALLTAAHVADSGIEPDGAIGRQATAAAVSPDGSRLAVRSYSEIWFFALPSPEHVGPHRPSAEREPPEASHADHSAWMRIGKPCSLGDVEPQGEALDFFDDSTLVTTSERARGRPGVILRVRC